MVKTTLFLFSALVFSALAAAQTVPGRYIVEFQGAPTAAVSAAKRTPYKAADADVRSRLAALEAAHGAFSAQVQALGGTVTHHYYTLVNAMVVSIPAAAAEKLRGLAGVKNVTPVHIHRPLMDQAVQLHRIQ